MLINLSLCIIGNIISIGIFRLKEFKKQPISFYLIASCLMNLVTIIYLPIMFLAPIWVTNDLTCKLYPGGFGLVVKIQAWLMALASFDRLITTMKPHSFGYKNNFSFKFSAVAIIILAICGVSFPEVYYLEAVVSQYNSTACTYPLKLDLIWIFYYYKIEYLLIRVVLPFLIMIVSTIIITWKMYRTKRKSVFNRNYKKEKNLFKSLLAFDLFFILFPIPMLVYLMVNNNSEKFFSSLTYALLLATGLISNVFFFLIMIVFDKVYRKIFRELMICKYGKTTPRRHVNVISLVKNRALTKF